MSEEKTQIFRGEEPPEMAIADTTPIERKKPLDAPVDQRGIHDQKDGESFERAMHDASGGPADQRRMDDADGLSELRQLHGKDARDGATGLSDADGPSDLRQMRDADHEGDASAAHHGDGPSDLRAMHDADGLSDQRHMEDAQGLSDMRKMEDAEGLSDLREMRDQHGLLPEGGIGDAATDAADDATAEAMAEEEAEAEEAAPEVMSDPDLTFKVEDDATPWALSIHLEERIASLGMSTTKVNQQLDRLDESIQRLAKRIAR